MQTQVRTAPASSQTPPPLRAISLPLPSLPPHATHPHRQTRRVRVHVEGLDETVSVTAVSAADLERDDEDTAANRDYVRAPLPAALVPASLCGRACPAACLLLGAPASVSRCSSSAAAPAHHPSSC